MSVLDIILGLVPLVLVSLAIAGATQIARTIVVYYFLDFSKSRFYTEIVLPISPVLVGAMAGAIDTLPVPDGFNSAAGRVVVGIVAGMFSGFAFRLLKSAFIQKQEEFCRNGKGNDVIE